MFLTKQEHSIQSWYYRKKKLAPRNTKKHTHVYEEGKYETFKIKRFSLALLSAPG
jgi:hypothetical protein